MFCIGSTCLGLPNTLAAAHGKSSSQLMKACDQFPSQSGGTTGRISGIHERDFHKEEGAIPDPRKETRLRDNCYEKVATNKTLECQVGATPCKKLLATLDTGSQILSFLNLSANPKTTHHN